MTKVKVLVGANNDAFDQSEQLEAGQGGAVEVPREFQAGTIGFVSSDLLDEEIATVYVYHDNDNDFGALIGCMVIGRDNLVVLGGGES